MEIKVIKDYQDIPAGSVIKVTKILKTKYKGIWAFYGGTYIVSIPKVNCERIINN